MEDELEMEVPEEEVVVVEPKGKKEKEWNFEELRHKIELSRNVEESVDFLIVGLADILEELSGEIVGSKAKDKASINFLAQKLRTAMPMLGLAVVLNTPFKK